MWRTAIAISLIAFTARAELRVESTMPGLKAHDVSAVADGDEATWFQSFRPPYSNDYISVTLGKPQKLTSVRVVTGKPDGGNIFAAGVLELSTDGKTFSSAVPLENGAAKWSGKIGPVAAIRVRATADGIAPIAIREIAMEDDVLPNVVVGVPGKAPFGKLTAKCDFTKVPPNYCVLMRDELDGVADWFFTYYPKIVALLDAPTDGLLRDLEIRFRNDMKPGVPGYVSGTVMTLSIPHIIRNRDDVRGLFIHELTHVVQSYSGKGERPGWLVEGLAEAVRYELSPPDDAWRAAVDGIPAEKIDYHNAYRDPARFLLWIQSQNNPGLLAKLNRALKDGSYKSETWTALTGKDPDAWLRAYRAAAEK